MEENVKSQDGGNKMLSISILRLNKLFYFSTYKAWVNILWYIKNIFCFLLFFKVNYFYSFTCILSTFHIGLLFTHVRRESFI